MFRSQVQNLRRLFGRKIFKSFANSAKNQFDPRIDYYQVLSIPNNADSQTIKEAYRKLAKKYHPDVSKGTDELFKAIGEAYEVLRDDKVRKEYDRSRSQGNGRSSTGGPSGSYSDYQNSQNWETAAQEQYAQYWRAYYRQREEEILRRKYASYYQQYYRDLNQDPYTGYEASEFERLAKLRRKLFGFSLFITFFVLLFGALPIQILGERDGPYFLYDNQKRMIFSTDYSTYARLLETQYPRYVPLAPEMEAQLRGGAQSEYYRRS